MFDEKWLREYEARTGFKVRDDSRTNDEIRFSAQRRQSKYGNVPTEADGDIFDSKHEAAVYKQLVFEARSGKYLGIARQVPFFLPGGVRYVADFVAFASGGGFTVFDAKSGATAKNAVYRLKKRQMRECLGIEIQEI